MSAIIEITTKVLPIILLIILGMLLRKLRFFKDGTLDDLKKIVVNLSLPALLFTAFTETAFQPQYMGIIVVMFLVCVLMLFFGSLFKKVSKNNNPYLPTLFTGFEAGMMGYAVFTAVFGAENTYQFAIIDLGQVLFVFFVLVTVLQRINGTAATARETVLSFIKTPVIIAIFTGILLGSLGLYKTLILPSQLLATAYEAIKIVSTLTTPLIGIIIGYELVIDPKTLGRSLTLVVSRMLVLLGLAFLVNQLVVVNLLHLDKGFQTALFTMFLLPSPFVIPVYMKSRNEAEKQEVLNMLSVHIVLSLIAFTVLVFMV